ncbi:hypothetical protein [Microbacterium sp. HSID17254]|uniref:hypothetical protein n=1 Tax=Microbacterium sp. HSID17254 TaxID=2419509 RepID=UPI000F87A9C9|nr:hypothetical protein [Microbacterium sp. HSID17254]
MGKRKPSFDDKQHQIELALGELSRRLDGQSRRLASAETRAGMLIAAASIVTGLLVSNPAPLFLLSMLVCISAVGFGIAALFPSGIQELRPKYTRDEILKRNEIDATLYITRLYTVLIDQQEKQVIFRLRMVRIGLILLGSSLLIAYAAVSTGM